MVSDLWSTVQFIRLSELPFLICNLEPIPLTGQMSDFPRFHNPLQNQASNDIPGVVRAAFVKILERAMLLSEVDKNEILKHEIEDHRFAYAAGKIRCIGLNGADVNGYFEPSMEWVKTRLRLDFDARCQDIISGRPFELAEFSKMVVSQKIVAQIAPELQDDKSIRNDDIRTTINSIYYIIKNLQLDAAIEEAESYLEKNPSKYVLASMFSAETFPETNDPARDYRFKMLQLVCKFNGWGKINRKTSMEFFKGKNLTI